MERQKIVVSPVEDESERSEYLSIKIDIERGLFVPIKRIERYEELKKRFEDGN